MEFDIEQLRIECADISANATYPKRLAEQLSLIEKNIAIIGKVLTAPQNTTELKGFAEELMMTGYWLYIFRDSSLEYMNNIESDL